MSFFLLFTHYFMVILLPFQKILRISLLISTKKKSCWKCYWNFNKSIDQIEEMIFFLSVLSIIESVDISIIHKLWICPFLFSVQLVFASCILKLSFWVHTNLELLHLIGELISLLLCTSLFLIFYFSVLGEWF